MECLECGMKDVDPRSHRHQTATTSNIRPDGSEAMDSSDDEYGEPMSDGEKLERLIRLTGQETLGSAAGWIQRQRQPPQPAPEPGGEWCVATAS
jgi:hypothetical protein